MAYFGKEFTFDREENIEELVSATGVEYLRWKPNQIIEKNGDTYKIILKDLNKEITYKAGVPFTEIIGPLTSNTVINVEGDTFTQIQDFGSHGVITIKREHGPNEFKATYTSSKWDGVAYRYFKAA